LAAYLIYRIVSKIDSVFADYPAVVASWLLIAGRPAEFGRIQGHEFGDTILNHFRKPSGGKAESSIVFRNYGCFACQDGG